MAQREDPRDNQGGNRERSFGGQHEQRLEADADRQYGRDRDQGQDFSRDSRETSDWQHRGFRSESRPYGSQGWGAPGRDYNADEWQSREGDWQPTRYGSESQAGRQRYGGQQDYGSRSGGQQYGGRQESYGRQQAQDDWSERQRQQGQGYGGRDQWLGGESYGRNSGMRPQLGGNYGQDYGRTGGYSGYGRSERIPGATTQSMLLGQESGWDDRARFDSPGTIGGGATRGDWYGGSSGQDSSGQWGSGQGYSQQSFRGRGPKGYERSDDRLREMICERLTEDPRIDASDVTVEVKEKVVTLTGNVRDRMTKYHIEEVVEECGGVSDVNNQLKVSRERGMESSSTMGGSVPSDRNAGSGTQTSQQGRTSRH